MKKIGILVLALFSVVIVLSACGGQKDKDSTVVKVGLVGDKNPQWDLIAQKLKEEGIKLELVKFGDYVQPNAALANGEIDMNAFQHVAFLENEIKVKGYKITAIADTIIAPIGLYSKKITSVSQLKPGDSIALPSDVTNGSRALMLLQEAGIIRLKVSAGNLPSVADITANPLKLKFIEVEAAQTPRLLDDVTAAFINGGHAVDAGLNPEKDSILLETPSEDKANPYVNVIVVRTDDKDNPIYKKIVDAYHSDDVKAVIAKEFKGAYLPAW
jgi:D-methionine transport system substrate-binding protein